MELYEKQQKQIKEEVDTTTNEVKEIIITLVVVVSGIALNTSIAPRIRKGKIKKEILQTSKKINSLTEKAIEFMYRNGVASARTQAQSPRERLDSNQVEQLRLMKEQLSMTNNDVLNTIYGKTSKIITSIEIQKNAEELYGEDISSKKKNTVFLQDSIGRKIQPQNYIALIVGDSLWESSIEGFRSELLLLGGRYAYHRSVIDDRTSEICLSLDGKLRDLLTDDLPPLHPNCRSWLEYVQPEEGGKR